jgi:hypothetical protein
MVSKQNGKTSASLELASPPVFDGMAAADGSLFVALMDGSIVRLGSGAGTE